VMKIRVQKLKRRKVAFYIKISRTYKHLCKSKWGKKDIDDRLCLYVNNCINFRTVNTFDLACKRAVSGKIVPFLIDFGQVSLFCDKLSIVFR
jgi:hypothetical protein